MLKKELCKKCCNNYSDSLCAEERKIWRWIEEDETNWEAWGEVYCPPEYTRKGETSFRKTTDQPPINCPYLLEYALNNQGKKENK